MAQYLGQEKEQDRVPRLIMQDAKTKVYLARGQDYVPYLSDESDSTSSEYELDSADEEMSKYNDDDSSSSEEIVYEGVGGDPDTTVRLQDYILKFGSVLFKMEEAAHQWEGPDDDIE